MLLFLCTEVTWQPHQSIPSSILNLTAAFPWSYSYTSTLESSDLPSPQGLLQKGPAWKMSLGKVPKLMVHSSGYCCGPGAEKDIFLKMCLVLVGWLVCWFSFNFWLHMWWKNPVKGKELNPNSCSKQDPVSWGCWGPCSGQLQYSQPLGILFWYSSFIEISFVSEWMQMLNRLSGGSYCNSNHLWQEMIGGFILKTKE